LDEEVKIMNFIEKNKKVLIVISIILLLIYFTAPPCTGVDCTKKEAGTKITGTMGMGTALVAMLSTFGPLGWLAAGVGVFLFMGPSIIGNWADVFSPSSSGSIPGWIYIAGFVVIIFMMKKN
jgi:hypothetical protein